MFSHAWPVPYTVAVGFAGSLWMATTAQALDPWPAESVSQAVNLTSIEGPEPNDFYYDLSGAVWNPVTRTLWVCRNGPGWSNSKIWAIVEDGIGGFEIDYRDGLRGEWTSFGDLEGITQADFNEDVVYVVIEGEDLIEEYGVSAYGTAVLHNAWSIGAYVPFYDNDVGAGTEGITFVPDEDLELAGFVDADGNPYVSQNGMGGIMLVGHQEGGRVYAFDLDRSDGSFDFVGAYKTGWTETAGLEFDRSTGILYVWHDHVYDILELLDLSSTAVAGQTYRQFTQIGAFEGPNHANNEGIAVYSALDCDEGTRSFFMTVDDGSANSLMLYEEFTDGCSDDECFVNADCDDGIFCNGPEFCVGGFCEFEVAPCAGLICDEDAGECLECVSNDDCDDSNLCTVDVCSVDGCLNTLISCPQGLACAPATGACDIEMNTLIFENGVGGYTGTSDTYIQASSPDANNGQETTLEWDGSDGDPPGTTYLLVRFDEIFGTADHQIPPGAPVLSAALIYNVGGDSGAAGQSAVLFEIRIDWEESDTFNTFGPMPGIQEEDFDSAAVSPLPGAPLGAHIANVTSSLNTWTGSPQLNKGWIAMATGSDGVQVRSSEFAGLLERPKLLVTYAVQSCTGNEECDDANECTAEYCDDGYCHYDVLPSCSP